MEQIGHYQLGEELGSGGMGTVYLGKDTRTDTTVAIKQLKSEIATAETIERFRREGEALRELNHPNIVKMLDTFEHEGQHYLVMEFVSGGDLKGMIDADDKLEIPQIVNMAIDLADALTRAHRLNIIHRDLKPANVLIGEDGVLRLTDFGVAHVGSQERVTDTDAIVGTIDYLPPEAFEGSFDERGDIWAFGVMLFEMLAGERPFTGGTLFETIQAIATKPIPDLEALCPSAPVALVDLVYRMLERDPQTRMSSVRYVGAQLEDILQGRDDQPVTHRFETDSKAYKVPAKHNLPAETTPFVGREHELAELLKQLKDPSIRLITILAQGGMGKTRLALELGRYAIDATLFQDGVYFVELAPLSNADNIAIVIADACGFQLMDQGSYESQLLMRLRDREVLLILDNYEHLPEGFGLAGNILKACPTVQIVATSRQRLAQEGESIVYLVGVDFPHWETSENAMDYAAVQLFFNNARRVQPTFELTSDNLDNVIRICKWVAGMPLGIVLSAHWLALLSIQEIVDELRQNLDLLTADDSELPERHRSIEAIMQYSWQQLTATEKNVFMQLAIFRGGFSRASAQAVTDVSLRILMSLVNKALIRRNPNTGRYEIHELLRQYAEVHLMQSDMYTAVMKRHANYFANLMGQWQGTERTQQLIFTLLPEVNNIEKVWYYAVDSQQWDILLQISSNYYWLNHFTGQHLRAFQAFDQLLTAMGTPKDKTQRSLKVIAYVYAAHHLHFYDVQDARVMSYALAGHDLIDVEHLTYPDALAMNRLFLIYNNTNNSHLIRLEDIERAIVQVQDKGNLSVQASLLASLGYIVQGYSQKVNVLKKAIDIASQAGDLLVLGWLYEVMFNVEMEQHNYRPALGNIINSIHTHDAINFQTYQSGHLEKTTFVGLKLQRYDVVLKYLAEYDRRIQARVWLTTNFELFHFSFSSRLTVQEQLLWLYLVTGGFPSVAEKLNTKALLDEVVMQVDQTTSYEIKIQALSLLNNWSDTTKVSL